MFCCTLLYVPSSFAIILMGKKSWLLCLVVLLVSRDCCVAPPSGAMVLSAVCDCGISWAYSLTIFVFVMFSRLFIAAVWSPTGKGLISWRSFVMFNCVLSLSHAVSWVRCGT